MYDNIVDEKSQHLLFDYIIAHFIEIHSIGGTKSLKTENIYLLLSMVAQSIQSVGFIILESFGMQKNHLHLILTETFQTRPTWLTHLPTEQCIIHIVYAYVYICE